MYFPDPWPKRRHQRRRVVTADFLALLNARLCARGLVYLATDDRDYFAQMKGASEVTSPFWFSVRERVNQRFTRENFKTNYELKFEKAGKDLYYLELQKR